MRVFKEITNDWSVPQANHTYILDDKKEYLLGYVPAGRPAREVRMLKSKIRFDWRYRKFIEIKG